MYLPRMFKVKNLDGVPYVLTKSADGYNVAFKDHPTFGTGCFDLSQYTVEHRLRYGMWVMVEDSFEKRIEFLQDHIDAVKFHLSQLEDAFTVFKETNEVTQ